MKDGSFYESVGSDGEYQQHHLEYHSPYVKNEKLLDGLKEKIQEENKKNWEEIYTYRIEM